MMPLYLYLAKVVICSGILAGYYWMFLRNKNFHQWNRFYLLGSVIASCLIPLIQFTVDARSPIASNVMLYQVYATDESIRSVIARQNNLSSGEWLFVAGLVVPILMLLLFLASLFHIYQIIKNGEVRKSGHVSIVLTEAKGTPFSFFHFIFWNPQLDMETADGKQILEHEVVHVQEKHSVDKLFMQLLLVFFWMNPFFWLLRNELRMVHEFIADKRSAQQDSTRLASMLLQAAHPGYYHHLINSYFESSIKRRLNMLTRQTEKIKYISRIIALPLIVCMILAFSVKPEMQPLNQLQVIFGAENDTKDTVVKKPEGNTLPSGSDVLRDTLPKFSYKGKELVDVVILKEPKQEKVRLFYTDGSREVISMEEAKKAGLIDSKTQVINIEERVPGEGEISIRPLTFEEAEIFKGIILLDGKEVKGSFKDLPIQKTEIASVSIIKGSPLVKEYGERARTGVLSVTSKKEANNLQREREGPNGPVFTQVEMIPKFPGGQKGWFDFIKKNLNGAVAVNKGAPEGTYVVTVQFVVLPTGKLSDITTTTNHGYGMEEEVIRFMKLSPDWEPAKQNGHIVKALMTRQVTFVISED